MEHLKDIATFFEDNPSIREKINKTFGDSSLKDVDILYNISQNKRLFLIYTRAECKKYINILEAFDNATADDIIIYFAELGLYGVFARVEDYYNICNNIAEKQDDGDIDIVSVHQLILADKKQKLVFISTGDSIDKIRKYVKDYFNADISINQNGDKIEITVLEPTATDFSNARELYDNLYDYIYKKDKNIASTLIPMHLLRERDGYKYTNPSVSDSFNAKSIEELVKALKTVISGNNNNIVFNIGCTNITKNITKVKPEKYSDTKYWIENNPPEDYEVTTQYYKKYTDNFTGRKVAANIFGKLVRDSGYFVIQSTNSRCWTK
ncbi:Hypothetical protein PACV_27 [Pacmanvirus A23]|uniref:Hypothetical protein n=1 Tax=Pacmanvirus A23 TaxID=1932881 RepID=UPI000A096337|nr:Hypothetical protein B9W72_gp027 [Pacmanvirus A23]SIP85744.1 Hypothetical protein PACV_27 [Pacmanvirus A23]